MTDFERPAVDGYGRPLPGRRHREPAAPTGRPLNGALNIGFELATQLRGVGVDSLDRLAELGAREVWLRLRQVAPERNRLACLLALQGAIDETHVEFLDQATVFELTRWRERHLADENAGHGPD